jgi:hypothetical protein
VPGYLKDARSWIRKSGGRSRRVTKRKFETKFYKVGREVSGMQLKWLKTNPKTKYLRK